MAGNGTPQRENGILTDMPAFVAQMRQPSDVVELLAGGEAFSTEEMQAFIRRLQSLTTREETNAMLHDVAPVMVEADSFHAAKMALLCGSVVEQGGDPSILADIIADRLMQQLRDLQGYVQAHGTGASVADVFNAGFPNAARAKAAIDQGFMPAAAMAMLCRDVDARISWRSRNPDGLNILTGLDDTGVIPYFLKRAFTLVDRRQLYVVDVVSRRVFQASLNGVHDTLYHCFALLQDALLRYAGDGYLDAQPTDPACVRYAQNSNLSEHELREGADLIEELRFDFCYPGGLFMPGSMSFWGLPQFGETPFLVVAKKGTSLSPQVQWTPNNAYPVLHQSLQSRVDIVRELESAEAEPLWAMVKRATDNK